MHLAGGMALGEVQLGEVEVVALDIRPLRHGEAEVGEDRGQFVDDLADRVDAAEIERAFAHGQRDIDRLGGEPGVEGPFGQPFLALCDRGLHAVAERVEGLAGDLALLRLHLAQRGEQPGDDAGLAQRCDAHSLQRRLIGSAGDTRHDVGLDGGGFGHRFNSSGKVAGF